MVGRDKLIEWEKFRLQEVTVGGDVVFTRVKFIPLAVSLAIFGDM